MIQFKANPLTGTAIIAIGLYGNEWFGIPPLLAFLVNVLGAVVLFECIFLHAKSGLLSIATYGFSFHRYTVENVGEEAMEAAVNTVPSGLTRLSIVVYGLLTGVALGVTGNIYYEILGGLAAIVCMLTYHCLAMVHMQVLQYLQTKEGDNR